MKIDEFHAMSIEEALELVGTGPDGLSSAEAAARLLRDGPNEIAEGRGKSIFEMLVEQFTALMVLILIAAGSISLAIGRPGEGVAIFAIVVMFGLLGFFQEYRAGKAIAALRRLSVPRVRVVRDGLVAEAPATGLVRGDLVLLEAGGAVPADIRLTEAAGLGIQESMLTGESVPANKDSGAQVPPGAMVGDRRNMAFMGTMVSSGRGRGIVTATGMATELGGIAGMLGEAESGQTPLQQRLDQMGKDLAWAGTAAAAAVFLIAILKTGQTLHEAFLGAISVAVAVVPEGLPAVVTITLALGARRMLKRGALIRKLPAVETLGSVTVICSDKTGTITSNRMTVTEVVPVSDEPGLRSLLLAAACLCGDAEPRGNGADGEAWTGDPTETALAAAAAAEGLLRADLEKSFPRIAETPFESSRGRMCTVHGMVRAGVVGHGIPAAPAPGIAGLFEWMIGRGSNPGASPPDGLCIVKGSVESVTGISSFGDSEALERVLKEASDLSSLGRRVLAFACGPARGGSGGGAFERDLVFLGLIAMIDPPRDGVREAVSRCLGAGIRPVMITGDHPLTAAAVAGTVGISAGRVVTGVEISAVMPALNPGGGDAARAPGNGILALAHGSSVFARVAPEHKLAVVRALRDAGEVVAMTGDGVNDAPALKQADIGVAMGLKGTDVAREASDMVLLDDDFSTIVEAVEEGRVIYDNLRRFVRFSVGGNTGKVIVMVAAPFMGFAGAPLLPLQLLWLNLATDGFLGLGMGFEPPGPEVMARPPRRASDGIFGPGGFLGVLTVGAAMAAVTLLAGEWYRAAGGPWQAVMFTLLAFLQTGQALSARSEVSTLWRIGPGTNQALLGMAVLVLASQAAICLIPEISVFFGLSRMAVSDLAVCAILGTTLFAGMEIRKILF